MRLERRKKKEIEGKRKNIKGNMTFTPFHDLVMKDERQAGQAQHQQEERADEAGPFVNQIPRTDSGTRHDRALHANATYSQ